MSTRNNLAMSKTANNARLLKSAVLGANDGMITTFAVVAGVIGAGFKTDVILVLGIANLIADGLSMSLGDYLGERSAAMYRNLSVKKSSIKSYRVWESGVVTFVSFVIAGSLPLLPYLLMYLQFPLDPALSLKYSILATASGLFTVGSMRAIVTKNKWYRSGLEMLAVGSLAAAAAYILGTVIEQAIT